MVEEGAFIAEEAGCGKFKQITRFLLTAPVRVRSRKASRPQEV